MVNSWLKLILSVSTAHKHARKAKKLRSYFTDSSVWDETVLSFIGAVAESTPLPS